MTEDLPEHNDPEYSVSSFLGRKGLHGLLNMSSDDSPDAIEKYNTAVTHGHRHLHKRVDHLFEPGASSDEEDFSKEKKRIHDWIEKGGITHDIQSEIYNQNANQMFAEGGHVEKHKSHIHNDHVANALPEQNILLQAAKGRASQYLSGLKPQKHAPRLAFDGEPDTREQEKIYDRALHIAAHPLSVLEKIKAGTIEPEHVKHLSNMYPEVNNAVQKKITERIIKAQLKGEKPDYHVRQGLSLLMGTPLSGELTQQNIQAAQAVFQKNKAATANGQQPQPVEKNKKSTSSLTKAQQFYLTGNQSRAERSQKQ